MENTKRILSFALAIAMVFSVVPTAVLATETESSETAIIPENAGEAGESGNTEIETTEGQIAVIDETDVTVTAFDGAIALTYSVNATVTNQLAESQRAYFTYGSGEERTEKLTISNQTDKFNYTFTITPIGAASLTVNGNATSTTSYTLGPNKSVEIEITTNANKGCTLQLTNFTAEEVKTSNVTFVYEETLGTVTVNGETVASGETIEIPAEGADLAATVFEEGGATFLGWMNATPEANGYPNGARISAEETTHFQSSGDAVVKVAFAHANAPAWFVVSGKYYTDNLSAASNYAKSVSNKTVLLMASGTLSGNHTVDSGVTLHIPYNENATKPSNHQPILEHSTTRDFKLLSITESVPFRTLTLKSGANITVQGELLVNSAAFGAAVYDVSMPHGPYGLMVLEGGSKVIVANGGTLTCFGYIIGTYDAAGNYTGGTVEAEASSTVYENFQVRDMRGTSASRKGEDQACFPMSQYYVQNIEAEYIVYSGADSRAVMAASDGGSSGTFADFSFIGGSGLFQMTSGNVVRVYDPVADRVCYTVNGDMNLDGITITYHLGFLPLTMNSTKFYLGINGNISILVAANAHVTVKQRIKMLPGAEITVAETGKLTVANSNNAALILYDSEDFYSTFAHYPYEIDKNHGTDLVIQFNNAGTVKNVVRFSPSRALVKGGAEKTNHGSAKLRIDGELIAYGNVLSTAGYTPPSGSLTQAKDYDNVLSGTGTYTNYASYRNVTLNEYYSNSPTWATVSTQPLLGNIVADGGASVTSFPNGTAEGVVYRGFYHNANEEYMWTDSELVSVTVKLMHDGEVVGTETMTVYSGMDLSGYFTDEACTQAAGDDFSGDTLYAKATASITRNGQELYFRSPNAAISKAWYDETVKLIDDVVLASTMEVAAGQKLTLDLNNHSISGAGDVLINNGTLDITGGATGEGITPGKLIAGGTAITNSGTIGTIGGNLEVEAKGYLLDVAAGAVVNTIGGTNGVVTMTQNNESGNYAVRVKGQIGTIGGTNANVTIKQINKRAANTATIFIDNVGGYITNIGGENATVNIIEDDQCETAGKFRIAIWINNGHIGTLGNGGTVNVISNNLGIYYGGSTTNICYIEKVATAGTVNITGPVVDGEQTACIDAFYINTNVSENDIGILGAGGTVNINASQYGIRLSASGADINQIATAGTVNITAGNIGIYLIAGGAKINTLGAGGTVNVTAGTQGLNLLASGNKITTIGLGGTVTITSVQEAIKVASGAEITTLGGKDSHVIITQNTGENVYLRTIHNCGTIDTIGGENAVVEITQNYQYTKGGSGNNPEVLNTSGTINRIGGLNAKVLIEQNVASGSGFGLRVDGGEVRKIGGSDVARVEIVSPDIPVYLAGSGKIKEIAQNTLFVRKRSYAQSVLWNTGTIEKITGGWFYSYNNTIADIFQKGVNAIGGASAAKSALNSIASGYALSDKTVSVTSEVMDKAYNCYPVLPVSEIDAEARIGNVYYSLAKTAITAAKTGDTITLLKDLSYDGPGLYFTTSNTDITLNLNNHSVTAATYALLNRGKISIYGGDLTDAEGNPLEPGKLITTGTDTSLSTCIYNQHYETVNGVLKEYDAHIYSIGGNLELIDTNGVAHGAIYNWGAHIGEIGTEGSKIKITGPTSLIKMTEGATLDTLGGAGSTIEMIQNAPSTAKAPYVIYVTSGTIDTIGAENATVKIIQNSATSSTNHGRLIYVTGTSAVIDKIGVASGSKVLMDQTVTGGATGWGLDVRGGGTVNTVGGTNSVVEIIGYGFPVYIEGASCKIGTVTGKTLMAAKTDYSSGTVSMWMPNPIQNITGGFYAQKGSTKLSDVFDDAALQQIASKGMAISQSTVKRTSEITGETYDCFYVYGEHTHSAAPDPVIEWITEDGQVMLRATAACAQSGCYEQIVAKSAATVTGAPEGNIYKLTYTATVSLGGEDYTETKTDSLQYAGEKTMKYDDRISGTDIRIIDAGEPVETSLKVGTKERDDAVITAYGNKLVATGIGEAVAYIDDAVYTITVEKAIIDLFMITGHSVGMGSQGNTQESVLLDNGQAYSFTVTNTQTGGYRYIDVISETEGVGLGYAAAKRPDEVDNFTAEGGGVIGEDSGLAWKWNQLTGHKVYVINSAVGSTSMYHWYIDKSNAESPVPILTNAITNFTSARRIIQNEVDAGHFEMGTMTMINHSSANYSDSWGAIRQLYNDEDGQVWFETVLGNICNAMNIDWDNDGTVEKASETMTIGFVPIWTRPKDDVSTSVGIGFGTDKPAVMYMGADEAYEDRFVASLIGLDRWGNDAKVQEYFKDYVQEYTAQNGQKLEVPSNNLGLYPDYVHYKQFAYNEMGIDVAKNVYNKFYGNTGTVSLTLMKTDGKTEVAAEGTEELNLNGDPLKLVPIVDPVTVSDLTFEATGSMGIKWPLTLYAKSAGEGSLTISYKGTVLKTLTMNVDAVAQVGETNYVSLAEAISNVPAEGTVVLLKDIELSTGITIEEGKNLTLDLNNHSITVAGAALTNYGTLNIMGGEAGEDKTPGALITTSGHAVVNYGKIGTIGGNLKLNAKDAAIHSNHENAQIDLIGGENAMITMNAAGSNAIYIQRGTIGTIGATGTGLVTINATNRGILVMSVAPKADGYDLEAITGNVTITSHGGAIYVGKGSNANKGSSVGTVGGNGTITIDRETATWSSAANDGAVQLVNGGKIHALGGANTTVAIESVTTGIYMSGGSEIGTIGSTGTGVVDIDTDGIGITLSGTNTKIGTIGDTLVVNSGGNALNLATGTTVGTLGGTDSKVTMVSSGSYPVNIVGGHIGTIGGKNAKVNLICDKSSGNTVVLNVSNEASGTVGTIGGENAEIILHQRGATTDIQYGILLNGTSTKTAQIEKIGAGAKFVEVIVDDCPVFLDSESKILAIEENVLLVARTVSTATTATHVFSGTPKSAVINGGKFCRGNSNDINVVLDSANQTGKNFTRNTVDVVANADGQTYKCFVAHNHPYTATVTDPTCTEPGYTTYTCDCGDTYVAEEVAASGHTYGVPAYNWEGTELTVTLTCDKCEEGTENKVLTGNAQGEVKSSTEGDCQTKATVTYTATVSLNDVAYTNETIIDGELGEHNLVVTEAKEATCTTPGNNGYYTCSVEGCGKVFKADKTTETTVEAETIQTTGHTPGEATEANRVGSTCTVAGSYESVVSCAVCGEELSRETVELPLAEHTAGEPKWENYVKPTCIATGKNEKVVYCSVCKAEMTREVKILEIDLENHAQKMAYTNIQKDTHDTYYPCCSETIRTDVAHSYTYNNNGICDCGSKAAIKVHYTRDSTYYFNDLQKAVDHISEKGEDSGWDDSIITLFEDVDMGNRTLLVYGNSRNEYSFVLDLNGKKLVADKTVIQDANNSTCKPVNMWIKDSVGGGEVTSRDTSANAIWWFSTGGDLRLGGGSIGNVKVTKVSNFTVSNGAEVGNVYLNHNAAEAAISGGTIAALTVDNAEEVWIGGLRTSGQGDCGSFNAVANSGYYDNVGDAIITNGIVVNGGTVAIHDADQIGGIVANGGTTSIYGGTIQGATNDISVNGGSVKLKMYYSNTEGVEFPGGISVSGTTLMDLLYYDVGFKVGDNLANLSANQTSIGSSTIVVKTYTITWNDAEGTVKEEKVLPGTVPTAPVLTKQCHTLAWNAEIVAATGDKTYTAVWTAAHTSGDAVTENNVDPSCTVGGSYDSVVYCSVCKEELSREKITVDALDHDWNDTTYSFAEDGTSCTATRVCKNDETHVETAEAEIASAEKTPATCEDKGTTTYTATFNVEWATTQTKDVVDIPAQGHTPGEPVVENKVDATCTADGSYDEVIYCSVCKTHVIERKTITVESQGHSYENGECTVCGEADPNVSTAPTIDVTNPANGTVINYEVVEADKSWTLTLTSADTAKAYVYLVKYTDADGVASEKIAKADGKYTDGEFAIPAEATAVTVESALLGDVSLNGKVNNSDAYDVLDIYVNKKDVSELQRIAGDVTFNNKFNNSDAYDILYYYVNKRWPT